MYDASKDKKIKHKKESKKKQEESTMTKTMKIEGMMCGHCAVSYTHLDVYKRQP